MATRVLTLLASFLVSLLAAFPNPAFAGLVGFYTFEGNTNDVSANGNNPTTGTVASYAPGVNGQAAFFNGSSNKLQLPIDVSPGVMPTLTMGAWVKASTTSGRRAVLSADDSSPANYDRQIGLDDRSNNEPTGGGAGGTDSYTAFCGGSNSVLWSGQPVSSSDYTFVAVRYDGSRVTLFIGDKVFSANDTTDDDAVHHPQLWIGKNPVFDSFFHGYMDNVFVFNEALSNSQLTTIRTGGAPAIVAAGSVKSPFMWGYNPNGELGDGTNTNRNTAVALTTSGALAGKNVSGIGVGGAHGVAVTTEGKTYTWGANNYGVLGDGTLANRITPVATVGGALTGKIVTEVGAGLFHNVALTSEGKIYGWGGNYYGQLGDGLGGTSGYPGYTTAPVATEMTGVLAGKTVTSISVGWEHTMALTSDGKIFAWGINNHGAVGDGSAVAVRNVPVAVDMTGALAGKTVVAISAGGAHSLALTSEGKVYGWGFNSAGAVGDGTTADRFSPVAIDMTGALAGKTVVAIDAGTDCNVVLASDGKFYSWGIGSEGSIGDGSFATRLTPVAVNMSGVLAGKTIVSYSTGGYHTIVLANDGKLYSWGRGGAGQLGNGGSTNSNLPVSVNMAGLLAGKSITSISADFNQTAVLTVPSLASAPSVATSAATSPGTGGATLNGTVSSNGAATDVTFQYSTNATLSSGVTTTSPAQNLAGSASSTAVSKVISGLAAHTTYYFRASGANSQGTTDGTILNFTTGNSNPSAPNATVTGTTGDQKTVTLTFPGSDADGDAVSLTDATAVAGLTVDSFAGTNVTFTPTASFVGNASFNYTVSDAFGGSASGTITVTVTDNDAPMITPQGNVGPIAATSPVGAVATFAPASTSDNVGVTSLTYSQASGTVFPIGTTTVTITATDAANNSAMSAFTVTVVNTAPMVALNGLTPLTFEASASYVDGGAAAFDSEEGVLTPFMISNNVVANVPGSYAVTWQATDVVGATGSATRIVNVIDTTAPVVVAHANVTAEATSAAGATVTYPDGIASDTVGVTNITYSQPSGAVFPIGTSTVTISAADAAMNIGTKTFTVTVEDTTAPMIATHADVTTEATSLAGATVTYPAAAATDAVGVTSLTYSQASGTVFPIGTTIVTITAKDAVDHTSTATFIVEVTANPGLPVAADDAVVSTTGITTVYPLANDIDPAGLPLSISEVSGPGVVINGRTLEIPAGYTGAFSYTASNGSSFATASVVVTAAPSVAGARVWSGLLFDSTGAIVGRAKVSNSFAGIKVLSLKIGNSAGFARFTLGATGVATSGLATKVGAASVTLNAEGQLDMALSGGITGTLRPAMLSASARTYNVAIAGTAATMPGGGYGTVRVRTSGAVILSFLLPDGKRLSASGELCDNGTVSVFAHEALPSLAPTAFLGGEFNFANLAKTDITGELEWKKPAQSAGMHRAGLNTIVTINGCASDATPGIADGPVIVRCAGGDFSAPFSIASTISSGRVAAVTGKIMDWQVNPVTKFFRIRFFQPASRKLTLAYGVYLPKSANAVGFFSGANVGGKVEIAAP